MMESEDASDKEASHCNPPKMDLSNNQHLEVISMLLMTTTEDHLKRDSIMAVTERLNVAHSTIHRLWKQVDHMCTTGVINSPELLSQKKIPGECLSIC